MKTKLVGGVDDKCTHCDGNECAIFDTRSYWEKKWNTIKYTLKYRIGFTLNEGGKYCCMVFRINWRSHWLFFYFWVDIKKLYIRDKRVTVAWVKGKWPEIRFELWLKELVMKERMP